MATHSKQNVGMVVPAALYLRIQVDDWERTFVLVRDDERVVAVGSASSADIQLAGSGISPIHFYFERIENGIWIVPAYCVSELRVNTARVSSPSQLGHRSIVEFGNTRIVVAISFLPYNQVGTAPKPKGDHKERIRRSYLAQLPDEDEPTHQPCVLTDDDEPTRQPWMGNERDCDACLETSTITLTEPKHDSNISPANRKWTSEEREESSSALARTLHAHPKSSVAAAENELAPPNKQRRIRAAGPITSYEIVNVAPLNRTLLGIAPLMRGVNESIHNKKAAPSRKPSIGGALSSPSQVATVFDGVPVPNFYLRKTSWLTRLGLLTKRYPVRVCLAAIAIALVGSGAVVFTTKMLLLKRRSPAIGAPIAHKPQTPEYIGKPPLPPTSQVQPPSIVVVSPGPTQTGRTQDFSQKVSRPNGAAEFGSAALSLVQGHYADARAAYASLAGRSPADRTYVAISKMLARRLGPSCANNTADNHRTSCPEIRP